MIEALTSTKTLVSLGGLVLLWFLETWFPFFVEFNQTKSRWTHAVRNLAFGAVNAFVIGAFFAGAVALVAGWTREAGFGLLPWLALPLWAEVLLAILIFDAWMYWWHRINHEIPFLWRFHKVHHTDPRVDVTSAVRFHPGEIILSYIARLLVIPLLGMALWQMVLYEAILLPIILLHHSNVGLPSMMDAALRAVIVSPNMHRLHHSDCMPETNSNYSSVFSWWDWVFRSYSRRDDVHDVRYGLEQSTSPDWHTFRGMIITPFRKSK